MALTAAIQAEIDAHGGLSRQEGPDQYGLVTYHAADGSYVVARPDGTLVMRGFAPPAEGSGPQAPTEQPVTPAPVARPGGAGAMDQQQVEAWIAAAGGPDAVQYTTQKQRLPNPAYAIMLPDGTRNPQYVPGQPPTVEVTSQQWVNSKTGATLKVSRKDDGSFDVIENTTRDPNKAGSTATQVSASPDQEYIVSRAPDGTLLPPQKNPNYRGPETKPGTTHFATGGDGKVYAIPVSAQGVAGKAVDTGLPAKPEPGQVVNVGGGRLVRVQPDGTTTVIYDNPTTPPQQDKDGQWYVVDKDAQGKPTIRYVTPQGAPTGTGPALPTLVLGQMQDGLRAFGDQLRQQVASGQITPAVATARWNEAHQIAQIGLQEAQRIQNDEESRRNADVNLRTNAMSNSMSGFNSALNFVQAINSTLPEGSSAGGAAFEAILGLQQLQAKRMGAYSSPYSGPEAPRSQTARGIDTAAQTATSGVQTAIQEALAQPAAPPAAPAASALPAPLLPPPPPVSGSVAPVAPAPPMSEQARDTDYRAPQPGVDFPGGRFPAVPAPLPGPAPGAAPSAVPLPAPAGPAPAPVPLPLPPNPPITAPFQDTHPDAAASSGMAAPGSDFAALQPFTQSVPAPVGPSLAAPDPGPDPLAMRRAQLASTPPWRLGDDALAWAMQNGYGEDAWRVPGSLG